MSERRTTIIPRDIKSFNTWIRNTNAFLLLTTLVGTTATANWKRYNWTNGATGQPTNNLLDLQNFLAAWINLYTQYDSKATYTTAIKDDMLVIIENVIVYAETNKLIQLIRATPVLTSADCITWNLPAKLALTVTTTHHVINEAANTTTEKSLTKGEFVYVKLIPKAGNSVHVEAFTEIAESGRPHKEKGYDLFEYAYAVFYSGTANLPATAADLRLTKAHSSHASFLAQFAADTANLTVLAAGAVAPVKQLILFGHWAKSKHPTEDAPWCGPFTTPLL